MFLRYKIKTFYNVLQTMKRNQQFKILEEAFKEADMISDGIATQLQLILPAKLICH